MTRVRVRHLDVWPARVAEDVLRIAQGDLDRHRKGAAFGSRLRCDRLELDQRLDLWRIKVCFTPHTDSGDTTDSCDTRAVTWQ